MSDVHEFKVLNRVVDSLDVRVQRHAIPTRWLRLMSDVWRLAVERYNPGDAPHYVALDGVGTFRLKMGGSRPYLHVLINPQICDVRIWNPARWDSVQARQTGQLYVSFRPVFLQFHGLEGVRHVLAALERVFCQPVRLEEPLASMYPQFDRVSRVDLAVDVEEERGMTWGDLDRFVTRTRIKDLWTTLAPDLLTDAVKYVLDGVGASYPQASPHTDNKGGATYNGQFPTGDVYTPPCLRVPRSAAVEVVAEAASGVLNAYAEQLRAEAEQSEGGGCSRIVTSGRSPQTVYFGRFGSPLYARRYNKAASLVPQNKLYMLDVWAQRGHTPGAPVWRTEFSLSGEFLARANLMHAGEVLSDLRDLSLLESVIPSLWHYLTSNWLRHVDPDPTDDNMWRWPPSALWQAVQSAWTADDAPTLARDHARRVPRSDKHLLDQTRGLALSAVALRTVGSGSMEAALDSWLEDFCAFIQSDEFPSQSLDRALELGLDDYTDTQLSALFRAERLQEGVGS